MKAECFFDKPNKYKYTHLIVIDMTFEVIGDEKIKQTYLTCDFYDCFKPAL